MEVNGQFHALAAFSLGKNRKTHWIRGSVGSRAGLDVLEKRRNGVPTGIRTPARPAPGLGFSH
jgi:hypothetical protein